MIAAPGRATSTPSSLGEYARRLALGAADVVRRLDPRLGTATTTDANLDVGVKSSDTDLVTTVDRASERWLVDQIVRDRPGDAVLGEEGADREGTSGVRWVLDPIDGTVNFVLGLPQYAVSVAAEVDGSVVAGAVCNPFTGELFHAVLSGGAWLGERRLGGPRPVPLERAVVGTGFSYDRARRRRQGALVSELLGRVADIRRLGAASLDLCAVAAGRLDAYFETGLNRWDYAAGALVATEAGCSVSGLRGQPVSQRFAVASGPELAPDLVSLLEELGADTLS